MVTQRKPKASKYLTTPTRPVQVDRDRSVAGLLEKMEGTGFGGRQLAEAHRIWLDMLGDNTTIIVSASGALIPAGMRRLLAYVIKNRFVDVLVLLGCDVVPRSPRNTRPLSLPGASDHDRRRVGVGADQPHVGPARERRRVSRSEGVDRRFHQPARPNSRLLTTRISASARPRTRRDRFRRRRADLRLQSSCSGFLSGDRR